MQHKNQIHSLFRDKVIAICEKSSGLFIWENRHIYADKHGTVFFPASFQQKNQLPAKVNYMSTLGAKFYDFDASTQFCRFNEENDLKKFVKEKNINEIESIDVSIPEKPSRNSLKNEILSCLEFVNYVVTCSFNQTPSYKYRTFADEIMLLVLVPYTAASNARALTLPTFPFDSSSSASSNLQKGDILFFTFHKDSQKFPPMKKNTCIHAGFFYGYDEKDKSPLICDLWNRENSTAVKVVKFAKSNAYTKFNPEITITYLSLDQLCDEAILKFANKGININHEDFQKHDEIEEEAEIEETSQCVIS